MDTSDLQELIRILESSNLAELEIEENGRRIRLRKPAPVEAEPGSTPVMQPIEMVGSVDRNAASLPADAKSRDFIEDGLITIDSPMVGTFYAAAAPEDAPFISTGDRIEPNQTVCIVEAMKIMNEVVAKIPGVVERVLAENGEAVEFGQPLFAVRPLV